MIYVASRDTNVPGPRGSNELWKSGVPGIAVGDQSKNLDKNILFSEYECQTEFVTDTEIFVNLPPEPHLLFASGRFLAVIVDGYPLSEVQVQAPEWFWPYLPEGVVPIKTRQARYYREYNFGRGFTPIQLATTPWNQLYFIGSSIIDPNMKLPIQMTNGEVPTIDIAIIGNGFEATATQSGLAEGLENACHKAGYSTIYMHSPKVPAEEIPNLSRASSVIACGDSAYAYAAVAMGKPCLVYIKPSNVNVETDKRIFTTGSNLKQYKQWPNVRCVEARKDYPPDPMAVLNVHAKTCRHLEVAIGGESE